MCPPFTKADRVHRVLGGKDYGFQVIPKIEIALAMKRCDEESANELIQKAGGLSAREFWDAFKLCVELLGWKQASEAEMLESFGKSISDGWGWERPEHPPVKSNA